MTVQCTWAFPHHDGRRAAIRCIREEGHAGGHYAYNGRWNAETEFRRNCSACGGTGWIEAPHPCNCGAGVPCPRCGTTTIRAVVDGTAICWATHACADRRRSDYPTTVDPAKGRSSP